MMFIRDKRPLLAEAGGAGGGGGGPSNGALSTDQKQEILDIIGTSVNNMVTARLKSFEKGIHEKVGSTISETLSKQLPELLQQSKPPTNDDKGGKGGKGGGTAQDDVETATLKRKLEELAQRADLFEKKAAEERFKGRQLTLTQTVSNALSVYGIDGARSKGALALLNAEGRIGYEDDDSDTIVFRGDDGVAMQLDIGLRQWMKTEDAKIFLPSNGTRGSSSSRGSGPQGTGGKLSRDQQMAALNELLDRNLP